MRRVCSSSTSLLQVAAGRCALSTSSIFSCIASRGRFVLAPSMSSMNSSRSLVASSRCACVASSIRVSVRYMPGPLANLHEPIVAGQLVDDVEDERHVLRHGQEVLVAAFANREEAGDDPVDVGHDDDVQLRLGSSFAVGCLGVGRVGRVGLVVRRSGGQRGVVLGRRAGDVRGQDVAVLACASAAARRLLGFGRRDRTAAALLNMRIADGDRARSCRRPSAGAARTSSFESSAFASAAGVQQQHLVQARR